MRATATAVLLTTLFLSGCASSASPARPEPQASAPASQAPAPSAPDAAANPAVVPVLPPELTAETLTLETTRVADAVQALIDPALILNVDDHTEMVDKSTGDGRYFGIIRTITLNPGTDAVTTATGMAATLLASGWVNAQTTEQGGIYVSRTVSSSDPASAWFAVIGGDASVPGESAISLQLASPDIP
jgi:hypothetical protein